MKPDELPFATGDGHRATRCQWRQHAVTANPPQCVLEDGHVGDHEWPSAQNTHSSVKESP